MLAVDSAFKSVVLGDIDSLKNSVAEIKLEYVSFEFGQMHIAQARFS